MVADQRHPDPEPRPERAGPPEPAPSWEEVAKGYGDAIYTMAYRLTGNADEAADLSQDVFVRVLRNLHTYRPGTFEGWLYRITKNLFLDRMRRRGRVHFEPLADEEWRQPVSDQPGPADEVDRHTLEAQLAEGLERLGPQYRLAIVLCDVEGLSYEEIADTTGWPLGTVRSRIHRARRQLRAHLEQGRRDGAAEGGAARAGGADRVRPAHEGTATGRGRADG